ncbi:MAG: HesA/MoeB/ThiF family protein [Euryarchaeota archaeon]|jgi:adenylyltransferase/sulfurtransferase|nr:HesA/MoeB/ThiF family protein [Euryarchaeota archaeon]
MERYSRQILVDKFGKKGQELLKKKSALVVGIGGTGGLISQLLVRAGLGTVYINDYDYVSISNIHRQLLYDENDIGKKKVEVAAKKLAEMNSETRVIPLEGHLTSNVLEDYVKRVDIVMDGTDNFETRFLLNDVCVKHGKPWIYSGVLATYGNVMPIIPKKTACLRCLMRDLPEKYETTSTRGILNSIPSAIASMAVSLAFRILLGENVESAIYYYDGWELRIEKIPLKRQEDCPACSLGRYDFL